MVEQQKARQMLFDATICIIIHVANGTEATWLKAVSLARPPGGILSRHILGAFVSVFISLCLPVHPSSFPLSSALLSLCLSVCTLLSVRPFVSLCLCFNGFSSVYPSVPPQSFQWMCVCMCVCLYGMSVIIIVISVLNRHTQQTDRQTDRQTGKQTDRQTYSTTWCRPELSY